jgi:ankyrin repeat protein
VKYNRLANVRLLLERGADPNAVNKWGRTPLTGALPGTSKAVRDALRAAGAKESKPDIYRHTALMRAVNSGELGKVKAVLAEKPDLEARDTLGATALLHAVRGGRAEIVKLLLASGAKPDARDAKGYAALHCAARAGRADLIKLLLSRRADPNVATKEGLTALMLLSIPEGKRFAAAYAERFRAEGKAAKDGRFPARLLIEHLGDKAFRELKRLSSRGGATHAFTVLWIAGAKIYARDRQGLTAQDHACRNHAPVLSHLLAIFGKSQRERAAFTARMQVRAALIMDDSKRLPLTRWEKEIFKQRSTFFHTSRRWVLFRKVSLAVHVYCSKKLTESRRKPAGAKPPPAPAGSKP